MASAVTCASSATGMSLVPAQTTAMVPLPVIAASRRKRIARGGEVLAARQPKRDCFGYGGSGARDQHVACAAFEKLRGDGDDLLGSFAQTEDHFRHPVAQRAVVIDAGEAEVLEGQVLHPLQGRIYIGRSAAHLFE
jgi:hypothetical protein